MATVLIPLPALDFDPTEVAVSWKILSGLGHEILFATPHARPARADELMVNGAGARAAELQWLGPRRRREALGGLRRRSVSCPQAAG